jgi:hypothetical protein
MCYTIYKEIRKGEFNMDCSNLSLEQKYDLIVKACLNNVIYRVVMNNKDTPEELQGIHLEYFNSKNKENLFFLEVCKMARSIFDNQYDITMTNNFFARFKIWWKNRKALPFIKKTPKEADTINVPYEVEMIKFFIKENIKEEISLSDIYTVYYERK